MSGREIKDNHCQLSEEVADRAVKKVFAILGVDIDKPESVEEFREDLRFGKRLRKAADHGMLVLIGAIVLTIFGAWLIDFKTKWQGH